MLTAAILVILCEGIIVFLFLLLICRRSCLSLPPSADRRPPPSPA